MVKDVWSVATLENIVSARLLKNFKHFKLKVSSLIHIEVTVTPYVFCIMFKFMLSQVFLRYCLTK